MVKIEFDRYSFIIDNKRIFIKAAAIHYFRLPGFETWKDRLTKLKYAGYNTLDIYFNWGFHSSTPGQYNFTGIKDVKKLLDHAYKLGFFIIARPGPYINAEVSGGGFPGWLLADKNITLRNRKNNDFIYSSRYMEYVKEWFSNIVPIINSCPSVIAIQVENEYYTNELEPEYIQELVKLVRSLGCNIPTMHNDMYAMGLYSDIVDIYAIDNYSVTYFEKPWQSFPEVFAVLDNMEENQREFCANSPLFIAELQAGWFDKWGGITYDAISKALGKEHLNIVTATSISQGVTAFTHYMGCGGTNWGNLGSTEVYSSYDFSSPLSESGIPTERFYQARQINNFLTSFDLSNTELAENQPDISTTNHSASLTYRTRTSLKDNSRWLFLRNDSTGTTEAIINGEYSINVRPQEVLILPSCLSLNEITINYSTLPFLCRLKNKTHQIILPETSLSGQISLTLPLDCDVKYPKEQDNLSFEHHDDELNIFYDNEHKHSEPLTVTITSENNKTKFIFLPENKLDYINLYNDCIILGPSYITDCNDNDYAATNDDTEIRSYNCVGFIKNSLIKAPERLKNIPLNSWKSYKIASELSDMDNDNWYPVKDNLEAEANGIYHGYFWYKTSYNDYIDTMTVNIRHCFAVYLNGEEIFSHDSFDYPSGIEKDLPVDILFPQSMQKDKNTLLILVQSMGHCKGFEDDAANPRGLLNYHTKPEIPLNWFIKQAFTKENLSECNLEKISSQISANNIVCYLTKFVFVKPEDHQVPLGIVFNNPPFNKADIYLNDQLIGHYWQTKGPQTKFYFPEGFYYQDGQPNTIKLIVWYRLVDNNNIYTSDLNNANIYIEPFGVYRLTKIEELV